MLNALKIFKVFSQATTSPIRRTANGFSLFFGNFIKGLVASMSRQFAGCDCRYVRAYNRLGTGRVAAYVVMIYWTGYSGRVTP